MTGSSWTEYEYEIAMKRSKPVLIFMLSDDTPVRTSEIEGDLNLVRDFRNKIKSNFLVQYFSSPQDIYKEALISLFRLRDRIKVIPQRSADKPAVSETDNRDDSKYLIASGKPI